jgi:hypothetical protein
VAAVRADRCSSCALGDAIEPFDGVYEWPHGRPPGILSRPVSPSSNLGGSSAVNAFVPP